MRTFMFVANQCINRLWSWWTTHTKTQTYRNTLLLELYGNCIILLFIFEVLLLLPTSLHNSTRVSRKSKPRSTQWLGYCHRMKGLFRYPRTSIYPHGPVLLHSAMMDEPTLSLSHVAHAKLIQIANVWRNGIHHQSDKEGILVHF